jgi:hypothetical protein
MVAFGGVALSVFGCSDDAPTADSIGQQLGDAFCGAMSRCCQAQGAPLSEAFVSACKTESAISVLDANVFMPDLVFNPDIAQQCLKAAANADCQNTNQVGTACRLVFSGHAVIGSACSVDRDCAQAPDAHALCESGTCVAAKLFQPAGATCPHADRLECDVANWDWCNAGVCARPVAAGGACGSYGVCAQSSYCSSIPPEMCMPRKSVGAACDINEYFSCEPPASCTNGVCTPSVDGLCVKGSL